MQSPPPLTARAALLQHRKRAAAQPALFLQQAAADEIKERLTEVNKTFTDVAIVTGWPQVWADILPDAKVVPDDEVLDLATGGYDLVIHALSLHWANDPVGQMVQCRRALRPDGLFIGTLFGGETLTELRQALAHAEAAVTGGLSPRIAPMAEIRDLGGLLQRAGFALPVADIMTLTATYPDVAALYADLRAMGETNALTARLHRPTRRKVFDVAAEHYQQSYGMDDGRLPATFDIITLTGWAPSDTQPKALRPGSAKTRLADALGTSEINPDTSKD